MNERIDELAFSSGIIKHSYSNPDPELCGYIVSPEKLEKFAELIVLECERVAKDPKWYSESPSNMWRNPIRLVCDAMKEHFGVEE